jgi:exopolyphosphatase/guanosine-5'-triphosphate,3'-diphosphate pyrophosphatase
MAEMIALIELGSNAVRCILAALTPRVGFQVLHEAREQTRLGGQPETLPPAAVKATIRAVRRFLGDIRRDYNPRILAVATAAVREAANRSSLLEKLTHDEGIEVRILSGEEEGRLGALAALWSFPSHNGVVADLGGGSLQLTRVRERTIRSAASLPLGAVRTTQRFFKHDPPTKQELAALHKEVESRCEGIFPLPQNGEAMVGLGGTVRTLARMHLTLINQQRSRQGFCLHRSNIIALRERLESLPTRIRKQLPGLREERADIILAGAIVVEEVMSVGGFQTLTVCTGGVRHGLLLQEAFSEGGLQHD